MTMTMMLAGVLLNPTVQVTCEKPEGWTFDGGHPNDIGYRMFADAGIAGYEQALRSKAVCRGCRPTRSDYRDGIVI